MLNDIRIEEIRARERMASKKSWHNGAYSVNDSNGIPICCQFTNNYDKAFIAHARQDIPYLLEKIEHLKASIHPLNVDWIERSERLPTDGDGNEDEMIWYYKENTGVCGFCHWEDFEIEDYSHWAIMEYPKPPMAH